MRKLQLLSLSFLWSWSPLLQTDRSPSRKQTDTYGPNGGGRSSVEPDHVMGRRSAFTLSYRSVLVTGMCKMIPGVTQLCAEDQGLLMKHGYFDLWLVSCTLHISLLSRGAKFTSENSHIGAPRTRDGLVESCTCRRCRCSLYRTPPPID